MIDIFRYFVLTIFNEHYIDYMTLTLLGALFIVALFGLLINQIKKIKYVKKRMPNLNFNIWNTGGFLYLMAFVFFIMPFVSYLYEYLWIYRKGSTYHSERDDLYEKEWKQFHKDFYYTGKIWRNDSPPSYLLIGRGHKPITLKVTLDDKKKKPKAYEEF